MVLSAPLHAHASSFLCRQVECIPKARCSNWSLLRICRESDQVLSLDHRHHLHSGICLASTPAAIRFRQTLVYTVTTATSPCFANEATALSVLERSMWMPRAVDAQVQESPTWLAMIGLVVGGFYLSMSTKRSAHSYCDCPARSMLTAPGTSNGSFQSSSPLLLDGHNVFLFQQHR